MNRILLAGFGGQGILFAGKFLAYVGLAKDKEVSWLPSYGPEMRGGTANCSVILAEESIGSPIVTTPDALLCMNLPSLDKFEAGVVPGGKMFLDSALIDRGTTRTDVDAFALPATRLAFEHEISGLANMIMIGKMLKETNLCSRAEADAVLEKIVPESKKSLLESNRRAIDIGYTYTA